MKTVDLNCDMGESFGSYVMGRDSEVLEFISSANIACGFHAGDPVVMRKTIEAALAKGVAPGAHPGYPDLVGFGRRNMDIPPAEIRDIVMYQVGAVHAVTAALGGKLVHVKPHGALYNAAAKDYGLALAIAEAVKAVDEGLVLTGLSGSMLIRAGKDSGLAVSSEVFADRAYMDDGSLVPRSMEGAVIHDSREAVERTLKMISEGKTVSLQGREIAIQADTVCLHGDNPEALEFARLLRSAIEGAGITVSAPGRKRVEE